MYFKVFKIEKIQDAISLPRDRFPGFQGQYTHASLSGNQE